MAYIELNHASVSFPILASQNRSLKKRFLHLVSGGRVAADAGKATIVRALQDVSLRINEGDRVGLVGRNGGGKSTILRVIAGVYAPTTGSVRVEGKIGSLIDINLGTDQESTGLENIYLRGTLMGMSRAQITRSLPEIIEFTELGEFINLPMKTYSSGMRMRVAFTVSTYCAPDILLMDEWLSVGDEAFRRKCQERLTQLLEDTKILVIASHSRGLIERVCNKAVWIDHGRVRMTGEPGEVCRAYAGS